MWVDDKFTGFDFETSGLQPEYALQPWRVAKGLAWATSLVTARRDGNQMVLGGGLEPTAEMMRAILQDAIDNNRTMVGWNTAFDISWFLAYGLEDLVFKVKWLDGMLLWRHWYIEPEYDTDRPNKKTYGLKSCVEEYLPQFAGYAEDVDFHDESPEARKKLHDYNIRDTTFTLRLTKMFYNLLARDDPQRLKAALIEADCLPQVAKANLEGMVIDTLATRELQAYLTDVAAKALEALAPHGMTEKIVRSPLQLAKLMYDDWGLPVLKENTGKKTGKVSRATDKESLHELSFVDDRAKLVRLYREALNNRTKFADALLISADYNMDGRSHPNAMPFGTYSGRFTYSSKQGKGVQAVQTGFALHQEKRGKEFRSAVTVPDGYTLMEFDASGQEFRWMAIASGDTTMLDLCLPGEDPHSYMGAQIRSTNYRDLITRVQAEEKDAKDGRQLGKVANLSLQYRTSARKLRTVARVQYNLPMELPEAQMIHTTYQRSYRGVPEYWAKQIAVTKRLGYVETLAGRRVQVVGDWTKMGWSMGSTAINYRIQGTGADQKYLALSVLAAYVRRIGAYFAWELHDGIYYYVPDAHVARAAVEIPQILKNLPYRKAWGIDPPVPLPWDCKTGKSWGALKDWKG
jgi:DNA polymerase-1